MIVPSYKSRNDFVRSTTNVNSANVRNQKVAIDDFFLGVLSIRATIGCEPRLDRFFRDLDELFAFSPEEDWIFEDFEDADTEVVASFMFNECQAHFLTPFTGLGLKIGGETFTHLLLLHVGFVIEPGGCIDGRQLEDAVVGATGLALSGLGERLERDKGIALHVTNDIDELRMSDFGSVIHNNETRLVSINETVKEKGCGSPNLRTLETDPATKSACRARSALVLVIGLGRGAHDRLVTALGLGGLVGFLAGRIRFLGATGSFLGGLARGNRSLRARRTRFLGTGGGLLLALGGLLLGTGTGLLRTHLDLLGEEEITGLDRLERLGGIGGAIETLDDFLDIGLGELGRIAERLELALGVLADVTVDHLLLVTTVVVDLALDEFLGRIGLLEAGHHAGEDVGDLDIAECGHMDFGFTDLLLCD